MKILRILGQIGPSRNGGHGNDGLKREHLYLAGSFIWFQVSRSLLSTLKVVEDLKESKLAEMRKVYVSLVFGQSR